MLDPDLDPLSGMPLFRCPRKSCNRLTSRGCMINTISASSNCPSINIAYQNYLRSGRLSDWPPLTTTDPKDTHHD